MNKVLENKNKRFWAIFWSIIWLLAFSMLILRLFIFQQVNVVGQSMEPNYKENQMLVINRKDTNLKRGQVVAFYETKEMSENSTFLTKTFPNLSSQNKFFLKRVIGLPGESIQIVGDNLIIYNRDNPDGAVINEDYLSNSVKEEMRLGCASYSNGFTSYFAKTKIPDNHYFLMGDNRCHSLDSTDPSHGPFPKESFFGQEEFRYWPMTKIKVFELPNYKFSEPSDEVKNIISNKIKQIQQ